MPFNVLLPILPCQRNFCVGGPGDGVNDFLLVVEVSRRLEQVSVGLLKGRRRTGDVGDVNVDEGIRATRLGVSEITQLRSVLVMLLFF